MSRWETAIVALMLGGASMLEHPADASIRLATELGKLRDAGTGRHELHVSRYVKVYASAIQDDLLTPDYLAHLELIAGAHDVGKIGIADAILLKPATLTAGEMSIVRAHVTAGSLVIEGLIADLRLEDWPYVTPLRHVVRHHHEHFDGSGYPDGLRGRMIPLPARIVAVADVFDALITGRPYKRAWEPEDALSYLSRQQGSQFDEICVRAFIERFPQILEAKRSFNDRLPSTRGS